MVGREAKPPVRKLCQAASRLGTIALQGKYQRDCNEVKGIFLPLLVLSNNFTSCTTGAIFPPLASFPITLATIHQSTVVNGYGLGRGRVHHVMYLTRTHVKWLLSNRGKVRST